jgi:chemotaxis protein MotB
MKQLAFLWSLMVIVCSSCGTGKKLADTNKQIMELNSELSMLNRRNDSLNSKLSECNERVALLTERNNESLKRAEACMKANNVLIQEIDDLNRNLEGQGKSMQEIRKKTTDALALFNDTSIEVKYRNGLVFISMPDLLGFSSGSVKISEKGMMALAVVAEVLAEYPHVSAIIVGNTDSLKVLKNYKDNWSLSTERANAVVRVLREKFGADPARLIAAGKSEYHPVASNLTSEERARNRSTYIILNPNQGGLWMLSQKYP